MKYAGFRVRFGAVIVDLLVFIPFIVIYFWLEGESKQLALAYSIPYSLLYAGYNIYFHGRFGQTLGKMALGIKVVRLDGMAMLYREAFLRHAVDLFLGILMTAASIIAYLSVSDAEYSAASGFLSHAILRQDHEPFWHNYVTILMQAWCWSELIVLLSNEKKRAIHDFIAGTVVIQNDSRSAA